MNALYQETEEILKLFRGKKLDIEIYREHNPDRDPCGHEPNRAYIVSKSLGGTLANNNGDGWIPIYPEKPNYPMRGKWFSPSVTSWQPTRWQTAVHAALKPQDYSFGPAGSFNETARKRAAKLRDPLRAAVMIAILEEIPASWKKSAPSFRFVSSVCESGNPEKRGK